MGGGSSEVRELQRRLAQLEQAQAAERGEWEALREVVATLRGSVAALAKEVQALQAAAHSPAEAKPATRRTARATKKAAK